MMIKYYTGTTYTSQAIHDATACYSIGGTVTDFKGVLKKYGLTSYGGYYILGYTDLSQYINANKLLWIRLDNTSSNSGHAVVGCGYKVTSSNKYIVLMDPNQGKVTITLTNGLMSSVPLSGKNYKFDYYITGYK